MPLKIIAGLLTELMVLAVFFGILDLIMLFMIKKNYKWITIITAGMAYLAVVFFGVYIGLKEALGHDIIVYMTGELNASLDAALKTAATNGADAASIARTREQADTLIIKALPAWFTISALFLVFLNYFVTRLYAVKKYGIKNQMASFELWHLNEGAVWILIAALAGLMFYKQIPWKGAFVTSLNAAIILGNLYFLIGFSVVTFLFKKHKVPAILQFIIIFMIIAWMFLSVMIMMVGVLDTWFNWRKIEKGGSIWK